MFPRPLENFARNATFLLLVPLAIAGCGRYKRTKQCRALIAQVNPTLDDISLLTRSSEAGVGGSGSYVAAAGRYERLAKQLGPMEFASEDMAKLVAEYAGLLNNAAENLRTLATALDANDAPAADRAGRELERIGPHERSVISRMETWCSQ